MVRSLSEAESAVRGVLFVCSSNFIRSPLAAALFNRLSAEADETGRFHAESAGAYPGFDARPAERRAQDLAQAKGLDLSAHRVREVIAADFEKFELLVSLDEDSSWLLRQTCPNPAAAEKIKRLIEFYGDLSLYEIADPVAGAIGYDDLYVLLERGVSALFDQMRKGG